MCKRSNALSRPVLMVRGLDGYFDPPLPAERLVRVAGPCSAVFKLRRRCLVAHPFGGDSEGATPLPIPNRAVKPLSADGTWASRPWESRSPPFFTRAAPRGGSSFYGGRGGVPAARSLDSAPHVLCATRDLDARDRSDRGRRPDRASDRARAPRRPRPRPPQGRLVGGGRAVCGRRPGAGGRFRPRLAARADGDRRTSRDRRRAARVALRHPAPGPRG